VPQQRHVVDRVSTGNGAAAPAAGATPIGRATRSNSACTGFAPSLARAWKIADFDGSENSSCQSEDHANPSLNWPSTSS
jgi:hypothetical protein